MKEYSPQTVITTRGGNAVKQSWISISTKGRIAFNTMMCEKMDLKEGDTVKFFQDEKNPATWYVEKCKDGFSLRKTEASNSIVFQSSQLCRDIIESIHAKTNGIKAKIYPEPMKVDKRKLYQLDFTLIDM